MSTRIIRRPQRRHVLLGFHRRMQILAGILLLFVAMPGAWGQQHGNLQLTIMDPDGNPVADAQISVRLDGRELSRATSNGQGVVVLSNIPAGMYELVIEKPGFQTNRQALSVDGPESAAEVTLLPKIARSENVEVRADADGSANNQVAASQSLQREEANSLPSRPRLSRMRCLCSPESLGPLTARS